MENSPPSTQQPKKKSHLIRSSLFEKDTPLAPPPDIETLKLFTIYNAARISPFVNGVSIGPNSAPDTAASSSQSDSVAVDQKSAGESGGEQSDLAKPKKKVWEANDSAEPRAPKSIDMQDLLAVAAKLSKQYSERESREAIRRELNERQQRIQAADQVLEQKYLESTRAAEERLLRKINESERRIREALELQERLIQENEADQAAKKEEVRRREQELKEKGRILTQFSRIHGAFKRNLEKFSKLFISLDRELQNNLLSHKSAVGPLSKRFEALVQEIQAGKINQNVVETGDQLSRDLEMLTNDLFTKAEKFRQQKEQIAAAAAAAAAEEEEKRRQAEQKKREEEAARQQQQQQQVQAVPTAGPVDAVDRGAHQAHDLAPFVSAENLQRYDQIMTYYKLHSDAVKKLSEDETQKKYRSSLQLAINTPINAISGVSGQHLRDKFDKLSALLSGQPVRQGNTQVSALEHPLGTTYCTLLLAKKFVNQAENITNNAKAEFPIAAIIVSLWQRFADFGRFFLAYLYKECPYLVPYFLPQTEGQSNEDYLKSLGYRFKDGAKEEDHLYLKRMSGIARLFAAIIIASPRAGEVQPHPLDLRYGWRWLCDILNLDPLPDICATLMLEVLQTAGHAMSERFGRQFGKLLAAIHQQYFPRLNQVDAGGPKSRLEDFIQKTLRDGRIPPPEGVLPANFW